MVPFPVFGRRDAIPQSDRPGIEVTALAGTDRAADGVGGVGIETQARFSILRLCNPAVEQDLTLLVDLTDYKLVGGPEDAGLSPAIYPEDRVLQAPVRKTGKPDAGAGRPVEIVTGPGGGTIAPEVSAG